MNNQHVWLALSSRLLMRSAARSAYHPLPHPSVKRSTYVWPIRRLITKHAQALLAENAHVLELVDGQP